MYIGNRRLRYPVNIKSQMNPRTDMQEYYDRRAPVYEELYLTDNPLRRRELAEMKLAALEFARNQSILEIACGTGFWTELVAGVARRILALDASPQMLKLARDKDLDASRVKFELADVYCLPDFAESFSAGLAGFWLSHVPLARLREFFTGFHKRLAAGARVFLCDNLLIPGMGGEFLALEGEADTFKIRKLPDGSEYRIIKNYYDEDRLLEVLDGMADNIEAHFGQAYWWVTYEATT